MMTPMLGDSEASIGVCETPKVIVAKEVVLQLGTHGGPRCSVSMFILMVTVSNASAFSLALPRLLA